MNESTLVRVCECELAVVVVVCEESTSEKLVAFCLRVQLNRIVCAFFVLCLCCLCPLSCSSMRVRVRAV